MKICPACREEFLDHITACSECHVPLVSELSLDEQGSERASKEELLHGEAIAFAEGGLTQCREIEKILSRAKVPCIVYPLDLKAESSPATLGSTSDLKYAVLLKEPDLDRAKDAMEGAFHAQVAKEGKGALVKDVVDLNQELITCPACGQTGALSAGECPSCGLCLDVEDAR